MGGLVKGSVSRLNLPSTDASEGSRGSNDTKAVTVTRAMSRALTGAKDWRATIIRPCENRVSTCPQVDWIGLRTLQLLVVGGLPRLNKAEWRYPFLSVLFLRCGLQKPN